MADVLPHIERLVAPFVDESIPGGGIDRARSRWQAPGRGSASGSGLFPGGVDTRYLRYLVDVLYRLEELTGETRYGRVADDQAAFMARITEERHPTWAWGNALEAIGLAHARGRADARADECSWVFPTFTCIDYLCRLYRHAPDPRIVDRCIGAARWTFESCQFEDGAVGITGRDDKWLGMTGNAVHQVALVSTLPGVDPETLDWLRERAALASGWMVAALADGRLGEHGVSWVHRTTTTDPLVNVGMQALLAALGLLAGIGGRRAS